MPTSNSLIMLDFYVDLASILLESNEKDDLKKRIFELIDEHKCFKFNDEEIDKAIDKNESARLFFCYKNAPEKVKNLSFIENLLRRLWLYNVCANYYRAITMEDLEKTVNKKYQDEKSFNKDLIARQFLLFEQFKKFRNNSFLFDCGRFYLQYVNYFDGAYKKLAKFFEYYNEKIYLKFIYNFETAKEDPIITNREKMIEKPKNKKNKPLLTANQIEQLVDECEKLQKNIEILTEENNSLNDIVETLNFEKRNLEVKYNFALKDTIRDLLNALNNQSWNNPLGELYLQSNKSYLDEKTKGIIANLFSSLGDIGIKIIKEKEIGKEIIITSENQHLYDPVRNEEIFLNDKVVVVYPGYRYKNETMIRPKIKKTKED